MILRIGMVLVDLAQCLICRYAVKDLVKTDARRKERKKTGLLKARKRPAWKRR
jgi:ribosomal protein S9